MKTKFTFLMVLVFILSSSLYSQNSQYLKRERKGRTKAGVESASVKENSFFYTGPKPQSSLSAQTLSKKSLLKTPVKPAEYVPGSYYMESFEEGTLPQGWQIFDAAGEYTWEIENYASYSGEFSAYLHYSIENEVGVDWLITPQYSAYSGDSLVFYVTPYDSNYVPDTLWVLASTENEVPSDSASLEAAFTDTLLTIAIDTLHSHWYRFSVSLEKYAGEKVYIAFKEFNIYGCGLGLDDVCLGKKPENDVWAVNLSMEKGLKKGSKIHPVALIKNTGSKPQSFSAKVEIGNWFLETLDFTELAPDSLASLNFSEGTLQAAGELTAKLTVISETDENLSNNTFTLNFKVTDALVNTKWHSEIPMLFNNMYHSSASYTVKSLDPEKPDTNFIYVFGGDAGDIVYKYNDVSKTWSAAGSLPKPLFHQAAVQVNGKAYLMGGTHENGTSTDLYIYDMEHNTLAIGASLPEPLYSPATGVYGDSIIYIAGGHNQDLTPFDQFFNEVYMYNIRTDTWSEAASLPGIGGIYMAGSISGNTFVVAGSGGIMSSESYDTVYYGKINSSDPSLIDWTKDNLPWGPIAYASSGSWSGKDHNYILIAGGAPDYKNTSSSLWIYDVDKEEWLAGEDKITPTASASGFVPVIRNDSVYMAVTGGMNIDGGPFYNVNEWLYLTNDKPLNNNSYDVFVSSIDFDTVKVKQEVVPSATFANKQLGVKDFTATMEITPGNYKEEISISGLAYNTAKQVNFEKWIPSGVGTYTVKVYTSLTGDEDKSNDTLTSQVVVVNQGLDVAPFSVDFDTVFVKTPFTPKATFVNKQVVVKPFLVTMKITPGSYVSVDTVEALAYNEKVQTSFADWTPDTIGTYTVKVYTTLELDENTANDTLVSQVVVERIIGTEEEPNGPVPVVYELGQNYPNPFNPATKIKYALPQAGYVDLKVYDMLGREVTTLVSEFKNAGYHEAVFNASALSSGVYIYRIKAGSFVQTKKLMLIK